MATQSQVLSWLKNSFDKEGFSYEVFEENNVIKTILPVDGVIKQTTMYFFYYDDLYILNADISLTVEENYRKEVSEYLTRANHEIMVGNFQMDFEIGIVTYRLSFDCEDRHSLSDSLIQGSIFKAKVMLEQYGEGLIKVMSGIKSPKEALKEAEEEWDKRYSNYQN